MVDQYSRNVLKIVVAQICQTIGWHSIQSTPLELLTDVFQNYLHELGRNAHRYGEQFGHTVPMLDDVGLAFKDMGISVTDLGEYVEYVASVPCEIQVPKYPLERESHLNLLKPGSREVVTRPVHIHEHLPAMHPQLEEDDYSFKQTSLSVDTNLNHETISPPLSSPKSNLFKRPGDPISFDHPMKKTRLLLEEEGRPLREISSVMMTTSGFLSPAREGKLPEARTPMQPFDSRSNSPQPLSYPAVPPEVKGEKKNKKNPPKVTVDSTKKMFDKENSKSKEGPALDVQKVDVDDNDNDDVNVKKLVSMKELTKLKALKSGAMKMLAQNNPSPGIVTKTKTTKHTKSPNINVNNALNISIPKVTKVNQAKSPKIEKNNALSVKVVNTPDKVKDITSSVVEGKISSEPDKQKLNILKKISKVKEEKVDTSLLETVKNVKEMSPILPISDLDNKQREVRWAQISETIEAVIQRSQELYAEPHIKSDPEDVESSETELFPYDDNSSPPGTPTTPRTPDLIIPPRKSEKSLDSKKKRKNKNKERKASRDRSTKSPCSPRRFKSESLDTDYMTIDKPKTPEVELSREDVLPTPVFPFYPHYPTTPGLIPPPINHVFFPRMNMNVLKPGCLMPSHPSMPNLPIPPPLFLQSRLGETVQPKPKKTVTPNPPPLSTIILPPTPSPSPVSIPSSPVIVTKLSPEKSLSHQVSTKGKSSEKEKKKEHKKDKKEKLKKKKDKKYKLKNKEKSEKKKEKAEKKVRDKEKNKEKKEKKKREKEREEKEKQESSVPKITLKFGPASPQKPPTPEPPQRKMAERSLFHNLKTYTETSTNQEQRQIDKLSVIKPVMKKTEDIARASTDIIEGKWERERSPSPELARISALVTRPPKPKSISKMQPLSPLAHTVLPMAEPPPQTQSVPQPSLVIQSKKQAITTFSTSPNLKVKDVPKKTRENEVIKETVAFYFDNDGNQVWICPACGGQDDGSPMIGCDGCDAWYHWVCVGIQVPPDSNDWFCRICISKKDELVSEKKKKIRKRKTVA